MAKDKQDTQIFRVDGKDSFVEIMNDCFSIGKVRFNFITYDGQTKTQKTRLALYMDTLKAVYLAEIILNGRFADGVRAAIAAGTFNGEAVNAYTSFFTDMGGINAEGVTKQYENLKSLGDWVQPGVPISRQFKIQKGTKMAYMLRGEYGPGRTSDTGLIIPTGSAKVSVNIGVTNEQLGMMAVAIKYAYEAYLNQRYSKFSDQLFSDDKCNVYTGNRQNG